MTSIQYLIKEVKKTILETGNPLECLRAENWRWNVNRRAEYLPDRKILYPEVQSIKLKTIKVSKVIEDKPL